MCQSEELEERTKLVALRAGDQLAFDYFYRKYRVQLYANILKLTKSPDLASELLQEVFVKIWQKRELVDVTKSFRAYIYTVAHNAVYDFFRRAARQQKLQEQLLRAYETARTYNPVEEEMDYRESLQLLEEGIAQLPPKCRHVYQLCKLEGKSYDEVAHALGISTATVNNHIVKATRILKRHLAYNSLAVVLAATIGSI